ncbi:NitT/TauT family transport system substrate-binding protein [Tistlia consotensis]|uniref:NitT/TauT family transport system substrate-binding protein n=1 Tax=Tistlia consotensis USBA 355 TaxID=560819 RepID=A0A1Y6BTS1_9PROT|nr:ABC transporter substrate-binding protein [Tistlia consotensis]SMF24879.1 NitT/TauT family transport system substrate-binding protein [Tistlia consotensis USBA 355]SNR60352.1 NitT/TauT family transport system substrate-binding protein [Tistlia consotensis]
MTAKASGVRQGRRAGFSGFVAGLSALALGLALAGAPGTASAADMPQVKLAIGGPSCLCYLPTVLAHQLGLYKKNGVDVEMIPLKGGSQALTAVLGGSADVVSGYYDHTVELQPKGKILESFVVYDRFPGLVLAVSPKYTDKIKTVGDLVGQKVGVSAPGSSTDFFLKYALHKDGKDPNSVPVVGIGLGATAVAAMEQGQVQAAVMLDPAVTLMKGKYKDLRILIDTRSQADTRKVFGGDYPGGALYAPADWVKDNPAAAQGLADGMVETLKWIHSHSAEEIMAKMPAEYVGKDTALYLAALKNTIPMYSKNGVMDPKGAQAVLDVFASSDKEVANGHVDLSRTYTNLYAKKAASKLGIPTE